MLTWLGLVGVGSALSVVAWAYSNHAWTAWLVFPLLMVMTLYYGRHLRMKKLSVDVTPLLQFRASQEQDPSSYLRLVCEYLDFSERVQARDAYWVGFQLDSGLVSDTIAETIEVSTFLGGSSETDSGGIGSIEPFVYPNELNMLRGRRTQLAIQQIPIKGEALSAEIVKARSEGRATARLEVRVFLKGYQPFILKTRNMAVTIRRAETP